MSRAHASAAATSPCRVAVTNCRLPPRCNPATRNASSCRGSRRTGLRQLPCRQPTTWRSRSAAMPRRQSLAGFSWGCLLLFSVLLLVLGALLLVFLAALLVLGLDLVALGDVFPGLDQRVRRPASHIEVRRKADDVLQVNDHLLGLLLCRLEIEERHGDVRVRR